VFSYDRMCSLHSSVLLVRIMEGRWSALSGKELVTVEVAFDTNTATAEARAVVTNETSLYYRCHQMMPVFNQTLQEGA
jgi:hypothetical protein